MSQTAPQILAVLHLIDTAEDQEEFIDAAIDQLNLNGAPTIANMTGTAGSKTATLTSKQRAAILYVTRVIFSSFYKNPSATNSSTVGNLSLSQTDLMSNSTVLAAIKQAAAQLRDDGTLPYTVFAEIELETTTDNDYIF